MKRPPSQADIERTWTRAKAARDYARWLAAVPAKERARVRAWVESCPARGRRYFWAQSVWRETYGSTSAEKIATELRRAAFAKPPKCSSCKRRRAVAVDADCFTYCDRCISPGDVLLVDGRC